MQVNELALIKGTYLSTNNDGVVIRLEEYNSTDGVTYWIGRDLQGRRLKVSESNLVPLWKVAKNYATAQAEIFKYEHIFAQLQSFENQTNTNCDNEVTVNVV